MLTLLFAFLAYSKPRTYSLSSPISIFVDEIGLPNRPLSYSSFNSNNVCKPSKNQPSSTLYDIFTGHRLINIGIECKFGQSSDTSSICDQSLSESQFNSIVNSIQNNLSYRFVVDDLKYFAPIGKSDNNINIQYYSEYTFNFLYNDENIIKFSVIPKEQSLKQLQFKGNYDLSFNVKWEKTTVNANDRFSTFYISKLFLNDSIQNKLLLRLIIELTILLVMVYFIYKQMLADFEIYNKTLIEFDEFDQKTKDKGWKMLHGDIFRDPDHTSLFSLFVSSGSHYFHTIFLCLILNVLFNFLPGIEKVQDNLFNTFLFSFILTSFNEGFTATTMCRSFSIRKWLRLVLGGVYFYPLFAYFLIVLSNFFNFKSRLSLVSLLFFAFVLFVPVTVISCVGALFSNRKKVFSKNPCQVALVPRQLPKLPFYLKNWFVCLLIGFYLSISFLPELFFILQSVFFDQAFAFNFGLFASFAMISLIAASSMIISTYFRLQEEYYKWHWISFLAPASSAFFSFALCISFFFKYQPGTTVQQLISFICYCLVLCSAFGLVMGFAGHVGTSLFIRLIFSNLKLD